jgi:hypothetical protein
MYVIEEIYGLEGIHNKSEAPGAYPVALPNRESIL